MTLFADDNYVIQWNKCLALLIVDMQRTIESVTNLLRQSGLKVNGGKTEVCQFHKKDHPIINITIDNVIIQSKHTIGGLGVAFDSKLQWQPQIRNSINKSKKAPHAIKLIQK